MRFGRLHIRFIVIAMGGCLLSLMAGCAWLRQTPVPPPLDNAPPELPALSELESGGVLGLLRIRDLGELADRVARWQQVLRPNSDLQDYRRIFALQGLDPAWLRPGEPTGVVWWDAPINLLMNVPAAGLLPSDQPAAARALVDRFGLVAGPQNAGYSLVAQNYSAVSRTTAGLERLLPLLRGSLPGDVALAVNAAALERRYGPQLDAALRVWMRQLRARDALTSLTQAQLRGRVWGLRRMLGSLSGLELQLELGDKALTAQALLAARAEQPLAEAWRRPQRSWPDLAQLLPISILRGQLNLEQPAEMLTWLLNEPGDPGVDVAADGLSALWNPLLQQGPFAIAWSIEQNADGGAQMEWLILPAHPDDFYRQLEAWTTPAWLRECEEVCRLHGAALQIDPPESLNTLGRKAHRLRLNIGDSSTSNTLNTSLVRRIMGPTVQVEFARLDRLVALTINKPLEPLLQRVDWQFHTPLESRAVLPAGGIGYADLQLRDYAEFVRGLLPAEASSSVPDLPEDLPAINLGLWLDDQRARTMLRIPRGLVAGVAESIKRQ